MIVHDEKIIEIKIILINIKKLIENRIKKRKIK